MAHLFFRKPFSGSFCTLFRQVPLTQIVLKKKKKKKFSEQNKTNLLRLHRPEVFLELF